MSRYYFVTEDLIIARIARIFKFNSNDWIPECREDIAEFIGLVGVKNLYSKVHKKVKVVNHWAELPCDLKFLRAIAVGTAKLDVSQAVTHANQHLIIEDKHFGTYSIHPNKIQTPLKNGYITLYYYKVPFDADGRIMIPDNEKFKIGCTWYCVGNIMLGGIAHPVLTWQDVEKRIETWTARARNSMSFPSPEEMEEIRLNNSLLIFDPLEDKMFNRK